MQYLGNMVVKPESTLFTRDTAKIPGIVARHVFQDIMHPLGRNVTKQWAHQRLVPELGKICDAN